MHPAGSCGDKLSAAAEASGRVTDAASAAVTDPRTPNRADNGCGHPRAELVNGRIPDGHASRGLLPLTARETRDTRGSPPLE